MDTHGNAGAHDTLVGATPACPSWQNCPIPTGRRPITVAASEGYTHHGRRFSLRNRAGIRTLYISHALPLAHTDVRPRLQKIMKAQVPRSSLRFALLPVRGGVLAVLWVSGRCSLLFWVSELFVFVLWPRSVFWGGVGAGFPPLSLT